MVSLVDIPSISQFDCHHKTVLMRVDLNVPREGDLVQDESRVERVVPTLKYLIGKKAKIVLISHFGRPKKVDSSYSLKFLKPVLEKYIQQEVLFANDCIGPIAEQAVNGLNPCDVLLLENLRFHHGEEKNDPTFSQSLGKMGDIFINEGFSVSHRAHSSVVGITHHLPSCAGFLMMAELEALSYVLSQPQRPVMAIVGGAKVSTKLELLENLIQGVDYLVVGGGIANTFLAAKGYHMGKSFYEPHMTDIAKRILNKAQTIGCEILLPIDGVGSQSLTIPGKIYAFPIEKIPSGVSCFDLGPRTVNHIVQALEKCQTVIWNGPVGAFEKRPFEEATQKIARKIMDLTSRGLLYSVAGGGETVDAIKKSGTQDGFSYLSTAGGAFLKWVEGKPLPGVEALLSCSLKPSNISKNLS